MWGDGQRSEVFTLLSSQLFVSSCSHTFVDEKRERRFNVCKERVFRSTRRLQHGRMAPLSGFFSSHRTLSPKLL